MAVAVSNWTPNSWAVASMYRSTGTPSIGGHLPLAACRERRVRHCVRGRSRGEVAAVDGIAVPRGSDVCWLRRCHGRLKDRRLGNCVEPGADLEAGFGSVSPMMSRCGSPTKPSARRLYVQDRDALRRELVACLRTGRTSRAPRIRTQRREARSSSAPRS